jgi:glycosyltransferase involved in cell wall biosynthesis
MICLAGSATGAQQTTTGLSLTKRLAIFGPSAGQKLGANVFGKDVANYSLFRALLLHGNLEQIDFLNSVGAKPTEIVANLSQGVATQTKATSVNILNTAIARESGTLLRGTAELEPLAWERKRQGAGLDYSLIGLIHTLAPTSIRATIGAALTAPIMPWDALVCTSPSVKTAVEAMFDDWAEYLKGRFGGQLDLRPSLPLIPLGVDGEKFAEVAQSEVGRLELRAILGVADAAILVIWVGRLSFFEKAFPQPMMLAIQAAAQASGKSVHFAMIGWFPNGEEGAEMYREAARVHAPDVTFHILNGNDKALLNQAWAGADVFISLVDNIQETFGITPIEAMAAGLPVVISDWDGYRYTVRDGIEGFLIPTLIGSPNNATADLVSMHVAGQRTYQQYVGIVAQHTAVNIGVATKALTELFQSRDLRKKLGSAGQQRIREMFDWKVVAPQYVSLATELAAIRAKSVASCLTVQGQNPVKNDPFYAFKGFATNVLETTSRLRLSERYHKAELLRSRGLKLDTFAANWRANWGEIETVLTALETNEYQTVGEILERFPHARHSFVQLALLWLAKMGWIDWL